MTEQKMVSIPETEHQYLIEEITWLECLKFVGIDEETKRKAVDMYNGYRDGIRLPFEHMEDRIEGDYPRFHYEWLKIDDPRVIRNYWYTIYIDMYTAIKTQSHGPYGRTSGYLNKDGTWWYPSLYYIKNNRFEIFPTYCMPLVPVPPKPAERFDKTVREEGWNIGLDQIKFAFEELDGGYVKVTSDDADEADTRKRNGETASANVYYINSDLIYAFTEPAYRNFDYPEVLSLVGPYLEKIK